MELEELEALGAESEKVEQPEVEQVEENKEQQEDQQEEQPEETTDLTAKEQIAYGQGWRPEGQFEGPEGNWKTAGEYIMYGENQQQIRELKAETRRQSADFDSRLAGLNKLHEAQTEAKINDLKKEQREAVENMDIEKFDKLESEINDQTAQQTKAATPATTDSRPQEIIDWEAKNPYINEAGTKKANDAQFYWQQAQADPNINTSYQSLFDYVDGKIAEAYPAATPTNPRREMPTNTEQSTRTTPRGSKSRAITMNDLTQDERTAWNQFSDAGLFSSEKEYLKAVTDARKG